MSRTSLIELLLLMSMFLCTTAIPLEDFYPYGPDVGDSQVNPAINHNGHISFGDVDVWVWFFGHIFYGANSIDVFIIPPNIDNVGGAVWFRKSTSQNTKERALTDIQRVYPSVSYIDQILIATWDHLHLLSQNYQTNTFQAVIATSGNETYIMYLYADGLMQWISQNGGINDYGGISTANVGYSSETFELPGSETCSIIHITSRSNVGIPGMFVFDLDGTHPVFVSECEEGDVRLVDSNMNTNASGRVEMCLGSEWRVVGDETWGVEEATVVCRQLGLPTDG
ncbi:Sushi, nidogen and EGF-like domain-containing protein 1 [Geodia barretti]|uniref:Sushi, nidogen and EGF-like domain-containing protein 1 n=1 Tax=Geodia barretti TaxID=519541 RepID=A0AA35U2V9_GEOBA|nr:Sushi, nidogen and EGF-like domain-containing protein 1 [Geodia barretti]